MLLLLNRSKQVAPFHHAHPVCRTVEPQGGGFRKQQHHQNADGMIDRHKPIAPHCQLNTHSIGSIMNIALCWWLLAMLWLLVAWLEWTLDQQKPPPPSSHACRIEFTYRNRPPKPTNRSKTPFDPSNKSTPTPNRASRGLLGFMSYVPVRALSLPPAETRESQAVRPLLAIEVLARPGLAHRSRILSNQSQIGPRVDGLCSLGPV